MRFSALIAATFALSLSAACTPAAPPSDAPPASGDVAAARAAWEARGPDDYAYQLEVSCFCIHRGQYAVEVRDGRLTSARDVATGTPAAADRVQYLVTVDQLFARIADASRAGTPVRAIYDPQLGYPTEAEVGLLADDSGTLYRISNLRAL
jgi:hypothetical protein